MLSLAVFIAVITLGAVWLLNRAFPKWRKVVGWLTWPVRRLTREMLRRKGLIWTGLFWWSTVAVIVLLIILSDEAPWLLKAKMATLMCFPPLTCWGLRYVCFKRRQRRYRLPKR